MAIYEFRCVDCANKVLEAYFNPDGETPDDVKDFQVASMHECEDSGVMEMTFDVDLPMKGDTSSPRPCPDCNGLNTKRVLSSFAVHWGLSATEKTAGTTKRRKDVGSYMRDARDKRKKDAQPGTKDAVSNEIWTGSEVTRGVIKGPEPKK